MLLLLGDLREVELDHAVLAVFRGAQGLELALRARPVLHLERQRGDAELVFLRLRVFLRQPLEDRARLRRPLVLHVHLRERAPRRLRLRIRLRVALQVVDGRRSRRRADDLALQQRGTVPVGLQRQRAVDGRHRGRVHRRRREPRVGGGEGERELRLGDVGIGLGEVLHHAECRQPVGLLVERAVELQEDVGGALVIGHRVGDRLAQPRLEGVDVALLRVVAERAAAGRGQDLRGARRRRVDVEPERCRGLGHVALAGAQRDLGGAPREVGVARFLGRLEEGARGQRRVAALQRDVAEQDAIEELGRHAVGGRPRRDAGGRRLRRRGGGRRGRNSGRLRQRARTRGQEHDRGGEGCQGDAFEGHGWVRLKRGDAAQCEE